MRIGRSLCAIVVASTVAGCVNLAPRYARPPAPVPMGWDAGAAAPPESPLPAAGFFADPHLQTIIATALVNNRDLRIAEAAIASARAQARVAEAARLPQADVTLGGASTIGGSTRDRYATGINVGQIELDLFGRLRNLRDAAVDRSLAAEAAARATRVALVTSIATAYYALATDRTLARLARANQTNGRTALDLTTARFSAGFASDIDVRQARTILSQARSDEQNQITLAAQDRNLLGLLVGAPIAEELLPSSIESVEGMLTTPPAQLSSQVLLSRPDVVQAELLLRADDARIGAARAAFFPSISLTGALGTASPTLGAFLGSGTGTLGVTGGALLPIFDAGGRRANLADVRAQRAASIARYERTIQQAFREVGDALAREATIGEQMRAQEQLVTDADASTELTEARYRAGIDTFLNTLVSQRASYAAQRSLAATRQLRALNRVSLFGDLGGDQRIPVLPARRPPTARPKL